MADASKSEFPQQTGRGEAFDRRNREVNATMGKRVDIIGQELGQEFSRASMEERSAKLAEALSQVSPHTTIKEEFVPQVQFVSMIHSDGSLKIDTRPLPRKEIHHYYKPHSMYNRYTPKREFFRNKTVYTGTVEVADPAINVAAEEFLHAAEDVVRGSLQLHHDSSFDPNVKSALSTIVHAEMLVDTALTLAALDMGPDTFRKLSNHARAQTLIDNDHMKKIRYRGAFGTILGLPFNERFQYPSVIPEDLDLWTEALSQDMDNLNLTVNNEGSVVGNYAPMMQLFELFMLAYGQEQLPIVYRLIDSDSRTSQIDFAKFLINQSSGDPTGSILADLTRRHKPLHQPISQGDLSYEFPQREIAQLNGESQEFGLPPVVTIGDLMSFAYKWDKT